MANKAMAFIARNSDGEVRAWITDDGDRSNGPTVLDWIRDGRSVEYGTVELAIHAMRSGQQHENESGDRRDMLRYLRLKRNS